MKSTASDRLHIVTFPAEALEYQLVEHGRDSLTFADSLDAESPGLGRVAVVVTYGEHEYAVTHLGWVKSVGRRQNMDRTLELSAVRELSSPILLSDIESELGSAWNAVSQAVTRSYRGGSLSAANSNKLRSVIRSRIQEGEWPGSGGVPEWMASRVTGTIRQDHTNAVGTALMFSGIDVEELRSAPPLGESPLAELLVDPSEASLIDNDLRNFPGMVGVAQREHIVRFTDRRHTLDVMNVNATGVEAATGVDLIYYNHDYDCFVLVQYKRMEKREGKRVSGVDARLPDQLIRMVSLDALSSTSSSTVSPAAFRLGASATFTKFAYPVVSPGKASDLTAGMYVPSALLKRLYDDNALRGPRGGAAITHDNLRRWLGNTQFAELVKEGWVGSSGVSLADIRAFINSSVTAGRIAVVAAHRSEVNQPG